MTFDMNRAWEDGVALVKGNFQLLAVIAGVFLLIPSIVFYLAFPDFVGLAAIEPGAEMTDEQAWAFLSRFAPAMLVLLLVQFIGSMAMIILIGGERPTVGEAIARAVRSLPTLIATAISIFVIGVLGMLLVILALTLVALALGLVLGEGGTAALVALLYVVLLPAIFYLYVRIAVVLPVVGLERARGFLQPLRRAWALTRGSGLRLFGFFALLFVAYIVISLLVVIVIQALGLLTPEGLTGSSVFAVGLVSSVIGALVSMVAAGIIVAVYRQLANGAGSADLEYEADT